MTADDRFAALRVRRYAVETRVGRSWREEFTVTSRHVAECAVGLMRRGKWFPDGARDARVRELRGKETHA